MGPQAARSSAAQRPVGCKTTSGLSGTWYTPAEPQWNRSRRSPEGILAYGRVTEFETGNKARFGCHHLSLRLPGQVLSPNHSITMIRRNAV